MSSFTSPLLYQRTGLRQHGRALYRLTADFTYYLDGFGSRVTVPVATGTYTDFASIPRPWRWLFPPDGRWAKAAVLHDWGYSGGQVHLPNGTRLRPSRFWWDVIFLEAMSVLRVPPFTRLGFFLAVRLFGGKAFQIAHKNGAS